MKEYLQQLKTQKFDGVYFLPDEKFESLCIEAFCFKEPAEYLPGSQMGNLYDIIIFSENSEPEKFQAILVSPVDYITRMINDGFYGIISSATTKSDTLLTGLFEGIKNKYFFIKGLETDA